MKKKYMNAIERYEKWEHYTELAQKLSSDLDDHLHCYQDRHAPLIEHLAEVMHNVVDFLEYHKDTLLNEQERCWTARDRYNTMLDRLNGYWWSDKQHAYLSYEDYIKERKELSA